MTTPEKQYFAHYEDDEGNEGIVISMFGRDGQQTTKADDAVVLVVELVDGMFLTVEVDPENDLLTPQTIH